MKLIFPLFLLTLCVFSPSTISSVRADTDFFYLISQWPGSTCSTKQGCCYPEKAKPARDFVISRLQPFYFNGTLPENCTSRSHFDLSKISNLVPRLERHWPSLTCPASKSEKLWSGEWKRYGTCSESILDEPQYFEAALKLMQKANLLKVLSNAGIHPNGSSYDVISVSDAIVAAGLHLPGVVCNRDKYGNFQLNQIILCSDYKGNSFAECPGIPSGPFNGCSQFVKFPSF